MDTSSSASNAARGASLRASLLSGLGWTGLSNVASNTIRLVVKLVLVRILAPSDFGVLALGTFALSIASLVQGGGLQVPLVNDRRKSTEVQRLFNTLQAFQLLFSAAVALLFFVLSVPIAHYYQSEQLAPVLRVFSFCIFFGGFTVVPIGVLSRTLSFRTLMLAENASLLIYGACAIVLSGRGMGVLAVAYAQALSLLVYGVLLMGSCIHLGAWRPSLKFERSALLPLLGFGGLVMSNQFLAVLITQGDNALVGKLAGLNELGIYTMAYFLGTFVGTTLGSIIGRVTYPIYCNHRDEPDQLRKIYLTVLSYSLLLVVPATALMAFIPARVTAVALSDKWNACIPLLPALALCGFFRFWNMLASTGIELYGRRGSATTAVVKAAQLVLIGPLLYAGYLFGHIQGVAIAATLVMGSGAAATVTILHRKFEIPFWTVVASFGRPLLLAAAAVAGAALVKNPLAVVAYLAVIGMATLLTFPGSKTIFQRRS